MNTLQRGYSNKNKKTIDSGGINPTHMITTEKTVDPLNVYQGVVMTLALTAYAGVLMAMSAAMSIAFQA